MRSQATKEVVPAGSGLVQSYHEGGTLDAATREAVRAAEATLRLMCLLPRWAMRMLLRTGLYRKLGRLPQAFVHLLDLVGGLHPGNNVMLTYIHQYGVQVGRVLRHRLLP